MNKLQGDVIFLLLESHLIDMGMKKIGDRLYFMEVPLQPSQPSQPLHPLQPLQPLQSLHPALLHGGAATLRNGCDGCTGCNGCMTVT